MGKYKDNPKYNVVSIRVTDAEKLALEEMMRRNKKSISKLMREALLLYCPLVKCELGS